MAARPAVGVSTLPMLYYKYTYPLYYFRLIPRQGLHLFGPSVPDNVDDIVNADLNVDVVNVDVIVVNVTSLPSSLLLLLLLLMLMIMLTMLLMLMLMLRLSSSSVALSVRIILLRAYLFQDY